MHFSSENYADNWGQVVDQLKERFYTVLNQANVVVATGSPFLSEWSSFGYNFEATWFDAEGNEFACAFDIDDSLESIEVEGCNWSFNWGEGKSESVEFYSLHPVEVDLEIEVKKSIASEVVEAAKLRGTFLAAKEFAGEFIEESPGLLIAAVDNKSNDQDAWFEIKTLRFPLVERGNEEIELSFWTKVDGLEAEKKLVVALTQNEFDELLLLS